MLRDFPEPKQGVTCAPPVLADRRFPQRGWERMEAAQQRHSRDGNSQRLGKNFERAEARDGASVAAAGARQ